MCECVRCILPVFESVYRCPSFVHRPSVLTRVAVELMYLILHCHALQLADLAKPVRWEAVVKHLGKADLWDSVCRGLPPPDPVLEASEVSGRFEHADRSKKIIKKRDFNPSQHSVSLLRPCRCSRSRRRASPPRHTSRDTCPRSSPRLHRDSPAVSASAAIRPSRRPC